MFSTQSEQLCFWDVFSNELCCCCLDMANHAAAIALDSLFVASPAQLHVLKIDDVCAWDDAAPAPNAAIDKRLYLNLVELLAAIFFNLNL